MNYPRTTTSWGIGTAKSFRNKSKMLITGAGTNLQNPSENICRLHSADDNKKLIQADCAGAEALIVAYCCRDGNFRELFKYGIKPHIFVALHIFASHWRTQFGSIIDTLLKLKPSEIILQAQWREVASAIKYDARRYFIGKKSCHSFNYMKMPQTFIFDVLKETEGKLAMSLEEGTHCHSTYHYIFPEIGELHREQETFLRKHRELRNLFGFPRKFYGPLTDAFFREAISFIPQSTVGCITNIAYAKMQTLIESSPTRYEHWDLLNNKHDSILMQVPDNDVPEAARLLSQSLEQSFISPKDGARFSMKSEVAVGTNWGHHNKDSNPEGLKEYTIVT